jgi:protein TonB
MATFDHPSDLIHRIAYPPTKGAIARIDPRNASSSAHDGKTLPVRSPLQRNELGSIFYFIEPRPRNPWAASGSLAFLSVLLLALIIIPLYHTEALPKMERLTMLYLQPPPAAGADAGKFQLPGPVPTYSAAKAATFSPVPKTPEATPIPAGNSDGVLGGVPGGAVSGISSGMLSGLISSTHSVPIPAKAPEPAPVKKIRVASRVVEANLIHDVAPQYPAEAGRARVEGAVVLLATIGTDGCVKEVRVESGLPILAQAAIDAVKQWRYKPYMIDGEPVEVDSRITVNFTLSAS